MLMNGVLYADVHFETMMTVYRNGKVSRTVIKYVMLKMHYISLSPGMTDYLLIHVHVPVIEKYMCICIISIQVVE